MTDSTRPKTVVRTRKQKGQKTENSVLAAIRSAILDGKETKSGNATITAIIQLTSGGIAYAHVETKQSTIVE